MDKKINLDEIIKYQMRLQNATDIIYMDNGQQGNLKDANFIVKKSMLEFGKQLLELAAENAILLDNGQPLNSSRYIIEKDDSFHCEVEIDIDKQSILDTIKQVDNG